MASEQNMARVRRPALEQAFQSDHPLVIDCPADYNEDPKPTEKLGKLVFPI